jgi:hypothetical protein
MRSLTFTCPQTGRAVDAGVTTDLQSLSSVQDETMCFSCPHCGMTHQFLMKSGYLAEPRYWPCIRVSPSRRVPWARQ